MVNFRSVLEVTRCNIQMKGEVAAILSEALEAADPRDAVARNIVDNKTFLRIGEKDYSLPPGGNIVTIALGKAAPAMLQGATARLPEQITRGVCVSKQRIQQGQPIAGIHYLIGDHPVPGEGSLAAGRAIRDALSSLTSDDLVLLLLSGGGSALATLPVEGVTLTDMQQLTTALLRSGASISEMNAVRKHLDQIKGGGLIKMAKPARVAALVLSDVVGSPLDVIASGPAYPDPTTFEKALEVLRKAEKFGALPLSITHYIEGGVMGLYPETVKPDDLLVENTSHSIVGSNLASCCAAVKKARELGFYADLVTDKLIGEARHAGRYLAQLARVRADTPRPYALIFGGETTVTVTGSGMGGRNQEVALAAVNGLAGLKRTVIITLATDGEDGPTDAAGAAVDGTTLARAEELGLDPKTFLANNDAYTFFKKTGDLLFVGPTCTNVNDISFVFGF